MAGCYRVLHIFGAMNRGGAEMRTLDLMRRFDPSQCRFDFCALSGQAGELDQEIRSWGGEIYRVKLDWRFPWRFRRLLRDQGFQAVHSHVHLFSGYILRLAAKEGVPKRIAHFRTTHDGHGVSLRRAGQSLLMRHWVNRYATDVLAVGEGVMRETWGPDWRNDRRARIIYNGLDPERYAIAGLRGRLREQEGIPAEARVYIHVGRMDPAKNHLRLVSIFAAILRKDPQAWLVLVGRRSGTDLEKQVAKAAERAGIASTVLQLGSRPDVPALLRMADVMVLPSLWEGVPGVVLEAAAVGTPVLASDIPGVLEVARHVSGIHTLPLAESDDAWARAAMDLARSREETPETPESNGFRLRDTPFVIERSVQQYREIYV